MRWFSFVSANLLHLSRFQKNNLDAKGWTGREIMVRGVLTISFRCLCSVILLALEEFFNGWMQVKGREIMVSGGLRISVICFLSFFLLALGDFFNFLQCVQCPPLKGKVAKILTWQWAKPPEQTDELDHTHHDKPKKQVGEKIK